MPAGISRKVIEYKDRALDFKQGLPQFRPLPFHAQQPGVTPLKFLVKFYQTLIYLLMHDYLTYRKTAAGNICRRLPVAQGNPVGILVSIGRPVALESDAGYDFIVRGIYGPVTIFLSVFITNMFSLL